MVICLVCIVISKYFQMLQPTVNVRNYDEIEIELLIKNGQHRELFSELKIDPNHVFHGSGNSILHLSAKLGSSNLTSALITLGCNVNYQNRLGNTALMDAVLEERLLQVKLLLKAKSDIHLTNADGDTALKLSLKSLDHPIKLAIMKYLFEHLKSTTTSSEEMFKSLTKANCSLTCAVYLNDVEVIKLMLRRGCDINDSNFYNGWTALHVAIMANNWEMIKLLVQHRCDVSIADVFGNLPLSHMLDQSTVQCPEMINALMPTHTNWTDLCYPGGTMKLRSIFVMGTKETLQLFLQSYDVNMAAKDDKRMTPLHYLASNSNAGVFDFFQNVDFDINAFDKTFKKTALHIAAVQGNVECIKFLLSKGADVDAIDYQGYTPLFYTISRRTSRENKYKECIELLVEHGANLQVVTTGKEDSIYRNASRCQNYLLIEPVLAHLAIIETAGKPIQELILHHIDSDIYLKRRYDFCKQELVKMRTKVVYGTVTLLKFLIDNEAKVALYTRKEESFNRIIGGNFVSHSYYSSLLRKRFDKAKKIDELRTKAALVLGETIVQFNWNHIIVNRITAFLSYDDLLKFS